MSTLYPISAALLSPSALLKGPTRISGDFQCLPSPLIFASGKRMFALFWSSIECTKLNNKALRPPKGPRKPPWPQVRREAEHKKSCLLCFYCTTCFFSVFFWCVCVCMCACACFCLCFSRPRAWPRRHRASVKCRGLQVHLKTRDFLLAVAIVVLSKKSLTTCQ